VTLLLVAHGTRDPAGATTASAIADAVATRLPEVRVRLAFADVCGPSVADVLVRARGSVVVVPAFLAAGYHVRVDLPDQIEQTGRRDVRLAAPLSSAPAVVAAAMDRLVDAGWRASDTVVLAAAGSSDPRARAEIRRAAVSLARMVGSPVEVGWIATGQPSVHDVVARSRGRVAVASWLLAPGLFHRWVRQTGADVVSEPLGPHPLLVERIVQSYSEAQNSPGSPALAIASAASDQR
jgi:sirohydrochlorin ferrochelatase